MIGDAGFDSEMERELEFKIPDLELGVGGGERAEERRERCLGGSAGGRLTDGGEEAADAEEHIDAVLGECSGEGILK